MRYLQAIKGALPKDSCQENSDWSLNIKLKKKTTLIFLPNASLTGYPYIIFA